MSAFLFHVLKTAVVSGCGRCPEQNDSNLSSKLELNVHSLSQPTLSLGLMVVLDSCHYVVSNFLYYSNSWICLFFSNFMTIW